MQREASSRARQGRQRHQLQAGHSRPEILPADHLQPAGLRADRSRGLLHGGGGLRDLRRRHVAGGVEPTATSPPSRRSTSSIIRWSSRTASPYKAHKTREAEFIGGRDKWFRPIDTRIGPDGALYITDFYNQAVVHNDTRGTIHGPANAALRPDRDHYFGRIWRVNHKQAKTLKVPNIAKASTKDLVEAIAESQPPRPPERPAVARREERFRRLPDAMKRLLSSWNFRGLEEAAGARAVGLAPDGQARREDGAATALSVDGKPAVQKAAIRIAAETPRAEAQRM